MTATAVPIAPPAWERAKLRSVCLPTRTIDPTRSPSTPFQYVDVSAVSGLMIRSSQSLTGAEAPSRARKMIQSGDVVLATIRPTLKRVARVPSELDKQLASTAYCVLRADPEYLDPAYLFFAVLTDSFTGALEHLQRGANYPAVSDGDVFDQGITIPPLAEQRAIANVLSKLQEEVEVEAKRVVALKELKAATMAKVLREGLSGENLKGTDIGEIPVGWRVARLGDVAALYSGGTPPKSDATYWSGPIPWVSPKDMKVERLLDVEDHISEEAAKNFSRIAPAGAVFVVVRGMVLAKSFPVAIAEKPMAFNQDMKALIAREGMDPNFLLFAVLGRSGDLTAEIGTSAHGTRRIGSSSLESFLLPVPPIEEQTAVGFALSSLERRVQAAGARKEILAAAFSAALQMLMTGQLRVLPLLESLAAPHE